MLMVFMLNQHCWWLIIIHHRCGVQMMGRRGARSRAIEEESTEVFFRCIFVGSESTEVFFWRYIFIGPERWSLRSISNLLVEAKAKDYCWKVGWSRCQLTLLNHLDRADQSLAGDGADRGQPPHQHLQVRPPALRGLHLSRDETRIDPNIYLTKTLNILSLWHVSSPANGARCEPGLAEHDGSLLHFFAKNQTSSEIISLAFSPKGAYDDLWPSPRDTLHVSTSAKKVSFCALPKGSLDNCPWLSVTLWWATWRNTL